jgi:hypothetical protein
LEEAEFNEAAVAWAETEQAALQGFEAAFEFGFGAERLDFVGELVENGVVEAIVGVLAEVLVAEGVVSQAAGDGLGPGQERAGGVVGLGGMEEVDGELGEGVLGQRGMADDGGDKGLDGGAMGDEEADEVLVRRGGVFVH